MADRDVTDADYGQARDNVGEPFSAEDLNLISEDQKELHERKQAVSKAVESKGGAEKVYATGSLDGQDFVVLKDEEGQPGEAFYVSGGRTKKADLAEVFVSQKEEGEEE